MGTTVKPKQQLPADPTGGHLDADVTIAQRMRELDGMQSRTEAEAYLRGQKLSRAELAQIVTAQGKKPGAASKERLIGLAVGGARLRGYQRAVDETMAQRSDVTSREDARLRAANVDRVRAAHDELATRPGQWVSIAQLREKLGDMPRDEQDAALKKLATTPGVQVIPWDNQNALRQADRDAALDFGGQENHAIRIDPPESVHMPHQPSVDELRADLALRERQLQTEVDAGFPEDLLGSRRQAIADLRERIAKADGGTKPKRGTPKKRFEDMTEAELQADAEARRARKDADADAQRAANGGDTDWQRAMREDNDELRRSGEHERRRLITALDTEQRTLTVKQREMARVEAQIADAEANGNDSGSRYEQLLDAREALQQDIDDLDATMAPMRSQLEALRRGDAPAATSKSKRGSLSKAASRLASAPSSAESIREQLRSVETRAEADSILSGLKGLQLKELERLFGIRAMGSVAERRERIRERTVGARLNSKAIRGL